MAEVVTGEAVILDLAVARFPSRMLAQLLDILIQGVLIYFVAVTVFRSAAEHLNSASALTIYFAGYGVIVIGYPTIWESLTRGKTVGKYALGIRVVSDDGSPIRFRQALIRALSLAFVELWLFPISVIGLPVGLITSLVTVRGKRLGDVFAGTFVIQERVPKRPELPPEFLAVPPPLAGWAPLLELSRLSDHTATAASNYLRRFHELRPAAQERLGMELAATVAAQTSPPPPLGTPPVAFLTAVLAVRRDRELARLRALAQTQAGAGGQTAGTTTWPARDPGPAFAAPPASAGPTAAAALIPPAVQVASAEPTAAAAPDDGAAPSAIAEPITEASRSAETTAVQAPAAEAPDTPDTTPGFAAPF